MITLILMLKEIKILALVKLVVTSPGGLDYYFQFFLRLPDPPNFINYLTP